MNKTDVLIIGAGPTGLFCAHQLGIIGLQCEIVDNLDKAGGQCIELYPDKPIYDIPAVPECTGEELTNNLLKQIKPFDIKFHLNERVEELKKIESRWHVKTSGNQEFDVAAIIIAGGVGSFEPRKFPVKECEKFEGSSLFYSIKDKTIFQDKTISIFGGGDSALDWALELSNTSKVNLIHRIRISSIEPNLLKNEIIEFVSKSKSFVPHFHIPLQSGSDEILKKMKRRYMTSMYKERVLKIKQCMPDACIGVDVICGFPGESEENFIETYSFLNDLPISYLHVFKYSERQNTEAFTMNKKIPTHIRNKRSNMLRMLSIKKRRSFYESQIGKKTNILLEGENKNGYIHGFTRNYVKVRAPWNPDLVNQIVFASLKEIDEEGFMRYEVII